MSKATPELEKMANCHPIGVRELSGSEIQHKALVLSPGSSRPEAIRAALRARGVIPFELDEVAPRGRTILELLRDSIAEADLVVAVMIRDEVEYRDPAEARLFDPSPDVQFGLGYAAALGKSILTFVRPGDSAPDTEIPAIPFDPHNPDGLDFWLKVLLNSPRPKRAGPRDLVQKSTPRGSFTDSWSRQLRKKERLPKEELKRIVGEVFRNRGVEGFFHSEKERSRVVGEVFRKAGVEDVSHPSETLDSSERADMVIWSNDFEPWIGNPILVNVVDPLLSPAELDEVRAKMARDLDLTHTTWGLLIDQGMTSKASEGPTRFPRILEFSLERLLDALKESSLGEFLLALRNARIHGKD